MLFKVAKKTCCLSLRAAFFSSSATRTGETCKMHSPIFLTALIILIISPSILAQPTLRNPPLSTPGKNSRAETAGLTAMLKGLQNVKAKVLDAEDILAALQEEEQPTTTKHAVLPAGLEKSGQVLETMEAPLGTGKEELAAAGGQMGLDAEKRKEACGLLRGDVGVLKRVVEGFYALASFKGMGLVEMRRARLADVDAVAADVKGVIERLECGSGGGRGCKALEEAVARLTGVKFGVQNGYHAVRDMADGVIVMIESVLRVVKC